MNQAAPSTKAATGITTAMIDTQRRVFARREREFTSTDEQIMRYVSQVAPQIES